MASNGVSKLPRSDNFLFALRRELLYTNIESRGSLRTSEGNFAQPGDSSTNRDPADTVAQRSRLVKGGVLLFLEDLCCWRSYG